MNFWQVLRLRVANRTNLKTDKIAELESQLPSSNLLGDIVTWGLEQKPAVSIASVVTADEFTHDIVMKWRDNLVLVIGST